MTGAEKRIASRALRYIVCENEERSAAIARAIADYDRLPGPVDLSVIEYCIERTTTVPNPVVKETPVRQYAGWTVREYADGTFDGAHRNSVSITGIHDSFAAVIEELDVMKADWDAAESRIYGGP